MEGGHKIRVYNTGASDKQANWQQIKTDTPDKGTQNTRAPNSSLQQGHGHLDSPQHDSKDTDGPQHDRHLSTQQQRHSQHNSKDTEAHDSQTQSDDGQRTTGRCFYAKKEFVCLLPSRSRRRCILAQLPRWTRRKAFSDRKVCPVTQRLHLRPEITL